MFSMHYLKYVWFLLITNLMNIWLICVLSNYKDRVFSFLSSLLSLSYIEHCSLHCMENYEATPVMYAELLKLWKLFAGGVL